MKTLPSSKKMLLIALLEDFVLILFLFSLVASSLEILLPSILAQRIPLALVFTVLTLVTYLYLRLLQAENIPTPTVQVPRTLATLIFILLILVGLFMSRGFGITGAVVQVTLLAIILWYWFRK